MERETELNDDGIAYECKASRLPWGNTNVKMNVGLSVNQFRTRKQEEIDRCNDFAPWIDIPDCTIVRNAAEAVIFLCSDHWHSNRTTGHSNFNYQNVSLNDLKYANDDDAKQWNIEVHDPFIDALPLLKTGFKADDAPMSNWPTETNSKTIGGIWGFFWKKGLLAHSRYSCVASIISGEGCHSNLVRYEILKQLSTLSGLKIVKFWCWNLSCWICIQHKFLCCFDWPFECSIGGFLGHTSNFPFHGICEFIKGECFAIKYDESKFKKMFEDGISRENLNINFDEWVQNEKSGIVLTTTECIQNQAERAQRVYLYELENADKNGMLEELSNNKQKITTLRRKIASDLSVYVIKNFIYNWEYSMITDYFHAFNTYILYSIKLLGLQSHCVFKNSILQTRQVFSAIKIPFVLKSINKYLSTNKSRNIDEEWAFTSNGHGYKLICDNINRCYNKMAWIEHFKLNQYMYNNNISNINDDIDMAKLVPTMKLAACYVAHKYLRRGWAVLWSSSLNNNSINKLKSNWKKGFNILLNFVPEIVSILFLF